MKIRKIVLVRGCVYTIYFFATLRIAILLLRHVKLNLSQISKHSKTLTKYQLSQSV